MENRLEFSKNKKSLLLREMKRKEVDIMKLNNVVPKMDEMFGRLEFAGNKEDVNGYVDGRRKVIGRKYHLYAEKQPADDITVILPTSVVTKSFEYEDAIELVNPTLKVEGQRIGNSGHASYTLYADDIKKIS